MSAVKSILWTLLLIAASLVLIEAIRLLMLRKEIGTYKSYWNAQMGQKTEADSLLYVALGDSAAQGIGATKPQKGYVGLLASALANKANRPVHVVNLSVTGATVSDLLKDQLPVLQAMNLPAQTVVTVEIGANDMAHFNALNFKAEVEQLFSQLPAGSVVADIPYFGGGLFKNRERNAAVASEIITSAADRHGLRLAPLRKITKANDSLSNYAADFFHPSNQGYQNWYQAFAEILDL